MLEKASSQQRGGSSCDGLFLQVRSPLYIPIEWVTTCLGKTSTCEAILKSRYFSRYRPHNTILWGLSRLTSIDSNTQGLSCFLQDHLSIRSLFFEPTQRVLGTLNMSLNHKIALGPSSRSDTSLLRNWNVTKFSCVSNIPSMTFPFWNSPAPTPVAILTKTKSSIPLQLPHQRSAKHPSSHHCRRKL